MYRHPKETACPYSPQGLRLDQRAVLKGRMTTTHANTQRHLGCLHMRTPLKTYLNAQVLPGNDFLPEPHTLTAKERLFPQRLSPRGVSSSRNPRTILPPTKDANSPADFRRQGNSREFMDSIQKARTFFSIPASWSVRRVSCFTETENWSVALVPKQDALSATAPGTLMPSTNAPLPERHVKLIIHKELD
jgi:hypothetical protein